MTNTNAITIAAIPATLALCICVAEPSDAASLRSAHAVRAHFATLLTSRSLFVA